MTYAETLSYLYSMLPAWHRIGKAAYKNDLHNSTALDIYFGHPHKMYRTIHVAGTNGKGSVSHMAASVLRESGLRTGLYTSPHLRDFRERIRVDGEMIAESEVIDFVVRHRVVIEEMRPSFFELTVAMALSYFADMKVDAAVIETGLGGRLDSTNIITPVVSVITNIGHDHMDLLGDSLAKIASEKAGIIKYGVPVIVSETDEATESVFREKANECAAEITFADRHYKCGMEQFDIEKGTRGYMVSDMRSGDVCAGTTPLGGDYQEKNIQAVFSLADFFRKEFGTGRNELIRGIENTISNTGLMGRWQILSHKPLTICDTGHNREGIQFVVNQLGRIKKDKLHIVLGFVNDKDLSQVLPLFPADAIYYFTKASVQRALDQQVLASEAAKYGLEGSSYPDVVSALAAARSAASSSDLVFIGGSTFVVADVL